MGRKGGNLSNRRRVIIYKTWFEQKIFWRIAGYRQFREYDQVRLSCLGSGMEVLNLSDVSGNVPNHRVGLGQGDEHGGSIAEWHEGGVAREEIRAEAPGTRVPGCMIEDSTRVLSEIAIRCATSTPTNGYRNAPNGSGASNACQGHPHRDILGDNKGGVPTVCRSAAGFHRVKLVRGGGTHSHEPESCGLSGPGRGRYGLTGASKTRASYHCFRPPDTWGGSRIGREMAREAQWDIGCTVPWGLRSVFDNRFRPFSSFVLSGKPARRERAVQGRLGCPVWRRGTA